MGGGLLSWGGLSRPPGVAVVGQFPGCLGLRQVRCSPTSVAGTLLPLVLGVGWGHPDWPACGPGVSLRLCQGLWVGGDGALSPLVGVLGDR